MRHKIEYEQDAEHFSADAYRVDGYKGVAWYARGWEVEPGQTEWFDEELQEWIFDEEPEPVRTGRVVCTMVGDDRRFVFDEEDVHPLERAEYCAECGQIGCHHDGYDYAS